VVDSARYVLERTVFARCWSRGPIDALGQFGVCDLGLVFFGDVVPIVLMALLSFGCVGNQELLKVKCVLCSCSIDWERLDR
jgi:hypothetical protein